MLKKTYIFILLLSTCLFTQAQDLATLQQLNARSKTIYIKADALDNLMIALRPFDKKHGNGIDSLLMDTYKNISKGYADNNHFKQGYEVYNMYLNYKIDFLNLQKEKTIANAVSSISIRKTKDNADQMELQNTSQQLQIDIDQLASKRINFKKYFSILIIALSLIFAALLVSFTMKYSRLKKKIAENKVKMRANQQFAVVGKFCYGFTRSSSKAMTELENTVIQIKADIKNSGSASAKKADQFAASLLKSTAELKQ
jgi:hypothetical protein